MPTIIEKCYKEALEVRFRWRNWLKINGFPPSVIRKNMQDKRKYKMTFHSYGLDYMIDFLSKKCEWRGFDNG